MKRQDACNNTLHWRTFMKAIIFLVAVLRATNGVKKQWLIWPTLLAFGLLCAISSFAFIHSRPQQAAPGFYAGGSLGLGRSHPGKGHHFLTADKLQMCSTVWSTRWWKRWPTLLGKWSRSQGTVEGRSWETKRRQTPQKYTRDASISTISRPPSPGIGHKIHKESCARAEALIQ